MGYQSWDWGNDGGYFKPKENAGNDTPRGYSIRAIKRELKWLGYDDGPVPMVDNGFYGTNMVPSVKNFQTEHGLLDDGVIGPRTMKELCRVRVFNWENQAGIPDHLLCRLIDLESAYYPACRNTYSYPEYGQADFDPDGDYGIAQIHKPLSAKYSDGSDVCPDDDWQYAFRIGVNVKVGAQAMKRNYKHLSGVAPAEIPAEDVWRATVMAHNAPAWAEEWMLAGFPETGGGVVTVGDWKGEKYTWCTLYCRAVYSRQC